MFEAGFVKKRLIRLSGSRMTDEGVLTIIAQRFHTQERNRIDGLERLSALILKAAIPPKPRRKTRPPKKSIEKRIQDKKAAAGPLR